MQYLDILEEIVYNIVYVRLLAYIIIRMEGGNIL